MKVKGNTTMRGGTPPNAQSEICTLRTAKPPLVHQVRTPGTGVIGKAGHVDFSILNGDLSKEHAQYRAPDDDPLVLYVKDLGSTNGTKLNGRVVDATESAARAGDELLLDTVRILVLSRMMEAQVPRLELALGCGPQRTELVHHVLSAASRGRHLVVVGPRDGRVRRIAQAFHDASVRRERNLVELWDPLAYKGREKEFLESARGTTVLVDSLGAGDLPKEGGRILVDGLAGGAYHMSAVIWLESTEHRQDLASIWGAHLDFREEVRVPPLFRRIDEHELDAMLDLLFAEMASGKSPLCNGGNPHRAKELGWKNLKRMSNRPWNDDFDYLESLAHIMFHRLQAGSEREAFDIIEIEICTRPDTETIPRATFRDWASDCGFDMRDADNGRRQR